ncbi:DNA-processing protein DprA [Palleronia sp. KMU-117]|uniref:DNA-processing protein DprA n=1 Tax=Palleronia sp. KMU-117 TaxID=3434108 RepID=UPI003D71DDDC
MALQAGGDRTVKDLSTSSTPSLTPPLTEEELPDWLRLLRSRRVGVTTFYRLLTEHGSARAALAALPEVARAAGVDDYAPCPPEVALAEIEGGRRAGARLVAIGTPGYPTLLAETPEAPPLLWVMGDTALLARPTVALVGARNASSLGLRMARKLAADLSEAGVVVVSGLARGIDTEAHRASLARGTVAVMAGGVDAIYPPENAVLAQEIAEKGLRLSEEPMHLTPQARHFPRRNRIIAGLVQALVVVEAATKSGSLITARAALDLGRDVLAVPGHPFDARAAGCNMLIRDGAALVRGSRDVFEALALPARPVADAERDAAAAPETPIPAAAAERRTLKETAALHGEILSRLGPSPLAEDQLIRDLGRPASAVTPELVTLELEGRIERQPGGLLTRAS